MRFLARFANGGRFKPSDAKELALSGFNAVKQYDVDVGNLRVSSTAVELDLLLTSKEKLEAATHVLEGKIGRLLTLRDLDTPPAKVDSEQAIREGIELFNSERYWESHEALESAWRIATGTDKEILQGLILTAAALVHLQKNRTSVALGVMGRAAEKLRVDDGNDFGVSIGELREKIAAMIAGGKLAFFKLPVKPQSTRAAA